jgi:hypothetical protein
MPACETGESKGFWSIFSECAGIHDNAQLVVCGPQSVVEQPVGVLGEREAVGGIVVLRRSPLFDVGGVHDGRAIAGDAAVAGESTG